MREHNEQFAPNGATAKKKNYHSPQFVVYGHIREITRTVGLTGANDSVTKTSLP